MQLIKLAVSLSIVIGVLVVGVYGIKRLGHWVKKPETGGWIQVVAQHSVGLKHHLVLVKVQEQLFLLGVSPQGMQFLTPVPGTPGAPAPSSENESQ